MAVQRYFPERQANQIPWINNFNENLPLNIPTLGGITPAEGDALIAELVFYRYLLETFIPLRRSDSQAATTYREVMAYGSGDTPLLIPEPTALPTPIPAPVEPGILTRLFDFVQRIKTAPGYTPNIGEELGIIGAQDGGPATTPPEIIDPQVQAGVVILKFRKRGHLGVTIESRREGEAWAFLAIDTSSPYDDARPLKVPGMPEWREYRMRYWDGEPVGEWSDLAHITVGN